jgi:Secretion system C-terminal sorting domain
MKKILLLSVMMVLTGLVTTSYSQCVFANAGIKFNNSYTDPGTNKCMISIDLYFDLKHNPGGKYVYVHIWPSSLYTDYSYPNTTPPTTLNGGLTNSIGSFGFFHQGEIVNLLDTYPPDANIPNFQHSGITITKSPSKIPGAERFTVTGLVLASPFSCAIPQVFIADMWESQSAQAQNIHCFAKGLTFFANDPKITGFLLCNPPRTYAFEISTINSSGLSVSYKVIIDNGDGIFNDKTDTLQVAQGNDIQLNSGNSFKYLSGLQGYLPYSGLKPYADRALWIVVTSPAITNEIYARLDNNCIGLPVTLKSFSAFRKGNTASLDWVTVTEADNKGFYIERRNGNSEWIIQGFVPSAAFNGNSNTEIAYQFNDNNIEKSNTLYRLRQIDMNGKISMSEIRVVAGKDNAGRLMVFPNPVINGELNLVFPREGMIAEIKLLNMNGQIVKQWSNFTGHRIYVNNIVPGVYTLAITDKQTREQFNMKVLVNK